MKTFLKENSGFFSTIGVLFALLLTMIFWSCGLDDDIAQEKQRFVNAMTAIESALAQQSNYNDVVSNLGIAKKDSDALAKSRKAILENLHFLRKIDPKLKNDPKEKYKDLLHNPSLSFSEVHKELRAFIDAYRKSLPEEGIKIKALDAARNSDLGVSLPEVEGQDQECFGFSAYYSGWSKFKDDDAPEPTHHKIYKQKVIISRLLDMLIEVKEDDTLEAKKNKRSRKPLELLGVKRELMEGEGLKGNTRETFNAKDLTNLLVEKPGKIETYAFQLEFVGHTDSLRKFIEKLKPPFIVSDVKISRSKKTDQTAGFSRDIPAPFELASEQDETPDYVPIITNVNSRFVVTIEYLMKTPTDHEAFLKEFYSKTDPYDKERLLKPSSTVAFFLRKHVFNELAFIDNDDPKGELDSTEMSVEAYKALLVKVYGEEDN